MAYPHTQAVFAACLIFSGALAQAQVNAPRSEERSTVETISLQSLDRDALADAVIEGGLAPSAAGWAPQNEGVREQIPALTDPLALTINDDWAGPDHFYLQIDIRYQDPKNVPGIEFGRTYNIAPQPSNRTYDYFESTTTVR